MEHDEDMLIVFELPLLASSGRLIFILNVCVLHFWLALSSFRRDCECEGDGLNVAILFRDLQQLI